MSCISRDNLPMFLAARDRWFLLCSHKLLTGRIDPQQVSIPVPSQTASKSGLKLQPVVLLESSIPLDKPQ